MLNNNGLMKVTRKIHGNPTDGGDKLFIGALKFTENIVKPPPQAYINDFYEFYRKTEARS